ncbi:Transposable element Tcb1 transposase, partial [Stegodyphus mimosarum]
MPRRRKRARFEQLTEFERGRIIGLREAGLSYRAVASRVQRNSSTVMRVWKQWTDECRTTRKSGSGPRNVTSARDDRHLVRMARTDRTASSRQLAALWSIATGVSLCASSIRRRLLQCGLRARTPLYRIPLTHDHRRLRLQWANQHRDWRADWQHVVFSDESRFNLWYHDGRIRVRRYAGERHLPECIIERHSGRTPGVMVWGAIAYHRRSQLLRIVGNLNSNRYIREVLQPEAVPFLQSLPGAVFQQDNARPHTARIVKSFFAAQQVQLLPWPACSPDMSPIEHVWDVIGRRLARDPRPVASADELWKRSDLSDFQKGMIIGFRAKGGSISETAEFVNCSRAAVVKVYRAWQNGTVQNQRRGKCGAPRAIDDRGERRLRRCVRADRRATVEQLTTKMNQGATKSVSQSTIQRTLLRLGLRSRRLVRAPMLTAVHRRRRLEFARQYSSWTSTEWRQVAFSDESRFMLHRTDGRWRIRRETSERNHPATIAGTVQAGGGSIMVWGMFSWHSLGSLIIVEGTMDQYKYASVLADHVHPYMRIVFPQDDGIFQQDNARCHTAASVRAWFEEHQDEFTVLPWPANSPDLNPIEHLWDHLDRVVRAMDPQPRNLAQLATALESAWLNIPENTFRDLCDSLPARLAAVRSAKVGYSGF